jgi:hypothetical protein
MLKERLSTAMMAIYGMRSFVQILRLAQRIVFLVSELLY